MNLNQEQQIGEKNIQENDGKPNNGLESLSTSINQNNDEQINAEEKKDVSTVEQEITTAKIKIEEIENININDDNKELKETNPISVPLPEEGKLKFYNNLKKVIKIQENILTKTSMAKEKIKYANEISFDQLKNFKENTLKYGKYLKLIHEELAMVSDLMKKIKKEIK